MKKYLIILGLILFPFICHATSFEAVDVSTDASGNIVIESARITDASASLPVFTNSDKVLVSNTMTGTGKVVMDTSPTITNAQLTNPALGTPASGVLTNATGTAASLTAGNVTTNANMTGPITGTGNVTSITSQTGTGTKFVVDTSPTIKGLIFDTSANFASIDVSPNTIWGSGYTGTGTIVRSGTPTLTTPNIGAATGTSVSVSGDVSGATFVGNTPTGTGAFVRATSPTITSPSINTSISAQAGTFISGSELVINGTMELDSGWGTTAYGTSENSRSSTQAHSGTYSWKMVTNSAYQGIVSTDFSVTVGHLYKITAWVYGDGSLARTLYFGDGATAHYAPLVPNGAGYIFPASWTQQTWIATASTTSSGAEIIFAQNNSSGTGTAYLDDVSVVELALTVNGAAYISQNLSIGKTPGYDASFNSPFALDVSGNSYFDLNVSVLSITDRTPYYAGDALTEIKAIKGKDGKIDHSTLPEFARKTILKPIIDKDTRLITGYKDESERDLGAMISIYEVAIKQLLQRIEALEKR